MCLQPWRLDVPPSSVDSIGTQTDRLEETLLGVKDLGEDLVQQTRAQFMTLEEVKDIKNGVTQQPPQQQEKDYVRCR